MSRGGERPSEGNVCCISLKFWLGPLGGVMRSEKGPGEGVKLSKLPFGRGVGKLWREGLNV